MACKNAKVCMIQEVLLRERNRHTDRGDQVLHLLSCTGGGGGGAGYPIPARGYPTSGTPPIGPGRGVPHPCWGYPTSGTPVRPGQGGAPSLLGGGVPHLGYPPAGLPPWLGYPPPPHLARWGSPLGIVR